MHRLFVVMSILLMCAALPAFAQPGIPEKTPEAWRAAEAQWQAQYDRQVQRGGRISEQVCLELCKAKRKLNKAAEARALALQVAALHPNDEWTLRAFAALAACDAGAEPRANLNHTLERLLDDDTLPAVTGIRCIRTLAYEEPSRGLAEGLERYLVRHPNHPQYGPLLLAQARMLIAVGEPAAALPIARRCAILFAGTADELDSLILEGEAYAGMEQPATAADILWRLLPLIPVESAGRDPERKYFIRLLDYLQQADDPERTAVVAARLVTAQVKMNEAFAALDWSAQCALDQGETGKARARWDALVAADPRHALAEKARQKLQALPAADK